MRRSVRDEPKPVRNFDELAHFAHIEHRYRTLRQERPDIPARYVWMFVNDAWPDARNIDEALCHHEWACTGSAYGGDDESYHGEGRSYCLRCGTDGDA